MNTCTSEASTRERSAVRLALLLLGSSLFALIMVQLSLRGIAKLGLSWAISPGPMLSGIVLLLAVYAGWRRVGLASVGLITLFFGLPLCLEFLPIPGSIGLALGVASVLIGTGIVYRVEGIEALWKAIFFLLGAYIQAVFIYNLFAFDQSMNFFRKGWTA